MMSSSLAMVLAALTLPGSQPVGVSGEAEQRLDLRGSWQGVLLDSHGDCWVVHVRDGSMLVKSPGEQLWRCKGRSSIDLSSITDEGRGRFRATSLDEQEDYAGLYKWERDRLVLCFREGQRPTSFRGRLGQSLLTLQRLRIDSEGTLLIYPLGNRRR